MSSRIGTAFALAAGALIAGLAPGCSSVPEATFATPEAALQAVAELVGSNDSQRRDALFGEASADIIDSGDDVADRADADRVKSMIVEKVAFEEADGKKIALLGNDAWPFPVPLVKRGERWGFDPDAGREEVLNRRIGRNELLTLATLRALVEAQREYASEGRDLKPAAYASQWRSQPGLHDGLYWSVKEGEPESPLGPLVAEAAHAGYRRNDDEPQPYQGYQFRMITKQGKAAPGGARSYVDAKGLLRGGFGVVAWPAKYGSSGIMTFQVNQQGLIFEKDLGVGTEALAAELDAYSPDSSWDPVED